MEDKVLRRTLSDALSFASVRELPAADDKQNEWVYAIALVSKRDGSNAYVIVRKNKEWEAQVVKDFGNISTIAKIEEVYPYLFLDPIFMPVFKGSKREDRISWLESQNAEGNFSDMTPKELKKAILYTAMTKQLKLL